jgi:hypothetical protein
MHVARDRYQADGYLVTRSALTSDWLGQALDHLDRLLHHRNSDSPLVAPPLATDTVLSDLVTDSPLTRVAAELVGPNPVLFGCTYVVKPAFRGLPVWWHQDGHPWRERLGDW